MLQHLIVFNVFLYETVKLSFSTEDEPEVLISAIPHLASLIAKGSYLRGNPVTMNRSCGNKNCKCKLEGKLHSSLYISKNKDGKRKIIYVPKDLEEETKAKLAAYRKIKDLTEKISEINYEMLNLKKKGDVKKDN